MPRFFVSSRLCIFPLLGFSSSLILNLPFLIRFQKPHLLLAPHIRYAALLVEEECQSPYPDATRYGTRRSSRGISATIYTYDIRTSSLSWLLHQLRYVFPSVTRYMPAYSL